MSAWSDAVAALSPHAWYEFNDTSGNVLTDSSGNGRHGNSGSVTWSRPSLVPGSTGAAATVGGGVIPSTPSGISVPNVGMTMAVTYKGTSATTGALLFPTNSTANLSLDMSSTEVRLWLGGTRTNFVGSSVAALLDGTAHFIVVVTRSTSAELWVDGTMVSSFSHAKSNTPFTKMDLKASNYPAGDYDEWLIFSSALSSSQIGALQDAWEGSAPSVPEVTGTLAATSSLTATSIKVGVVAATLATSAVFTATSIPVASVDANFGATASFSATSQVVELSDYAVAVLADSPTHYYRLGEPSGSDMLDSSGNGNDGTYSGTYTLGQPSLVPGDVDTSAIFGATFPPSPTAVGTGPHNVSTTKFTVEAIVARPVASDDSWFVTIARANVFELHINELDLPNSRRGIRARVWMEGSNSTQINGDVEIDSGEWGHVAVMFDSVANTFTARLNGVLIGSVGVPSTDFDGTTDLTTPITITSRGGWIDEVAYYANTVLTAGQVQEHFASIPQAVTLSATAAFSATVSAVHTRTATLATTAAFSAVSEIGTVEVLASLDATVDLTAAIEVPILAWTDTTNRLGGRHRGGFAVATWEPPVVTPPPGLEPPVVMDVARAMTAPTITKRGPVFTVTKAEQRADRTRILVGGKDVTYFRGVRTPTPDYQLVEPLLYSDATIELPQVYGMWETLGTGSLKWAKLGKTVVIQRVNDAGEIVGTDYRGKVMDYDLSGPTTRLLCSGEAEGPASTMIRPLPVFKFTSDAGARIHNSLNRIGLRTKSFNLMADTGIDINSVGSMTELEFIQQVCSVAVTRAGDQYTITRLSDGTWDFRLKDTTTIHATAYFDDAGIVPNLRRDMRAEPNRVFGSGITPDGRRFRNAKYEGLVQGVAAPYPFTDGSAFGEGTTNADTDTGDGVSVMILRLNTFGYISRRDLDPGTYDDAVSEAIEELQDDAGLPQTGNMNQATWKALWDIDVTGYSAERTSVNPIAQRTYTRRYNYSATGQIMGINENYDPSVMVVDENIDFGTQVKVRQMRRWSRRRLNQALTPNWIGTLDLNTALIQGEHNPGDPLSNGLVMTNRHLRPGMNIWAPLFDGGTLFHVSGVSVSDDGQTVRAVVDTRARDLMAAWEIHTRNQETARNTARGRFHQWRQSGIEKDAIGPWDTYGGLVQEIELQQGWNVFEVVAGQEGTIQRMRIATDNPTEFAVLVSGLRIGKKRLASLVPNPLADPGEGVVWYEKRAVRKALRDRLVLVSYGTHDQPCGYGDRVKVKDGEPTGAPLTGVMDQAEGFTYNTYPGQPILHVAVYAKDATKIPAGRIMWNAADAGS